MIEVVHRRICDHCGRFDDYTMRHDLGGPVAIPSLPDGWRSIEGKVYCDNHKLLVKVDSKQNKVKRRK